MPIPSFLQNKTHRALLLAGLASLFFLRRLRKASPKPVSPIGKSVAISGCDSGFGRLLAVQLVAQGFTVFAGCLSQAGIEGITKEAEGKAGRLVALQLDVTKDESVAKFAEEVEKTGEKGLFALVNNAGLADNFLIEVRT